MPAADGGPFQVRPPVTAERMAASIRRDIVRDALVESGHLPPVAVLTERYGVSAPTVREALRILEAESLIQVQRGAKGGARVRRPDSDMAARYAGIVLQSQGATILDVLHARRIIEPAAVRDLAVSPSPEMTQRLRAAIDAIDPSADLVEQVRQATAFHILLVGSVENLTLKLIAGILANLTEAATRAYEDVPIENTVSDIRHAIGRYRRIVDHIERGEPAEAERSMRRVMEIIVQRTLRRVGEQGASAAIDLLGG